MSEKANILVIDDEAIMRDGCTKILSKEGYGVQAVENGRSGVELLAKKDFDLILLDLMMPGMGGIEVLTEVKKINPDIYIIVITGYATIETAVEAMKGGAFDYIPKPFTPDQLRIVIRKAMENKALILEAERLRMEQEKGLHAIAQEKSRIKTILNCMPNGLLVMDAEKRIVLYNPSACKLLNIPGESAIGTPVYESVSCDAFSDMVTEVLCRGGGADAIISGEIACGEGIPVMAHLAPVKMGAGEVVGAIAILQDISDQKALDRMKADFIAKIAHELKAPAATVNQLMMTVLSGAVGDLSDELKEILGRAVQRGEGLIDLISDLLNISKIESGLAVQKKVLLDIREVVDASVEMLKPLADEKKIPMQIHLDRLPQIYADREGMGEVFNNLLSNAIKYSENGGTITVSGETQGDYVKISVADTGMGISEKNLPFVFEKFFRVKNTKTRQIVGTGLGLPIVKEIVDAHLGSIEVTSEEGKGSTFSVLLPRKIE